MVVGALLLIPPLILLVPSLVLVRTIVVFAVDVVGILSNFRTVGSHVASATTLCTSHARTVNVHDFLFTFINLLHEQVHLGRQYVYLLTWCIPLLRGGEHSSFHPLLEAMGVIGCSLVCHVGWRACAGSNHSRWEHAPSPIWLQMSIAYWIIGIVFGCLSRQFCGMTWCDQLCLVWCMT